MNSGLLSTKAISQLFERMTYIYAHKWVSVMGEATDEKGELTTAAKTWQSGLTGVTLQQLGKGLEKAALSGEAWNPSLPEFRALCSERDDLPSIEQVVKILAVSVPQKGTVANRFKHPLVLAIAKDKFFDSHLSRNGTTAQCIAMVKPIYNRVIKSDIIEFNDIDYQELAVITASSKNTKSVAMAALAAIKIGGFVTEEKLINAKQIIECVDFKKVDVVPVETEDEILKRLAMAQPTQKEIEHKEWLRSLKNNLEVSNG